MLGSEYLDQIVLRHETGGGRSDVHLFAERVLAAAIGLQANKWVVGSDYELDLTKDDPKIPLLVDEFLIFKKPNTKITYLAVFHRVERDGGYKRPVLTFDFYNEFDLEARRVNYFVDAVN